MAFSLRTRILLAFGLALAVLGALGVGAWQRNSRTIAAVAATMQSAAEVRLISRLEEALVDADRAARDFIYQVAPARLEDFRAARVVATQRLDSLRTMMREDSVESALVAALSPLVASKLEFSAATLLARQGPDGSQAAFQLITSGRGWQLADAIRLRVAALKSREDAELAARSSALVTSARAMRAIASISIIATVLIVGVGAAGIIREVGARARAEQNLTASSALLRDAYNELRDLYDNAPCGYHSVDVTGLVVRMNDTELRWLGYAREDVVGRMNIRELVTPAMAEGIAGRLQLMRANQPITDEEMDFVRKDGTILPTLISATSIRDAHGEFVMTRTVVVDITQQRHAQDEALKAVTELANALSNVKTLTGLLPICSMCRNVRDDRGYWAGVEQYVSAHTDAQFSHGVCPECFPKMFPGVELEAQGAPDAQDAQAAAVTSKR